MTGVWIIEQRPDGVPVFTPARFIGAEELFVASLSPWTDADRKVCAGCGVAKMPTAFTPDARYVNGLFSYCRDCMAARSRTYRDGNAAYRVRERMRMQRRRQAAKEGRVR